MFVMFTTQIWIVFAAFHRFLLLLLLILLVLFCSRVNNLTSSSLMENCKPANNAAVPALQQLIQEFYAPYTKRIAISVHGSERYAIWRIRDFVHELQLELVNLKYSIEDGRINAGNRRKFDNRQYSLIIVDGLKSLEYLDPAAHTRNYDIQEFYVIYLMKTSVLKYNSNSTAIFTDLLQYFWKNYIINVSLMVDATQNTTELYTYLPFASNQRCRHVTLRKINEFINNSWVRKNRENFFPNKVHNFNRCPLKIAVFNTPPYLSVFEDAIGHISITDFEAELLLELSRKLNFTMDFIIPPNDEQRGKVLPNGSTNGALRLLQQRQADLSFGCFRYTLERMEILTGALPYYQTWQVYGVLRKSLPYSSLEILTFAFDLTTWYCLCCSLQLMVCITFVLQCQRHYCRLARIIMGVPTPRTPLLNIFAIILGYPLVKLPHNTFTRYTIVLCYIFGLTLRIAYQSLLYKLLQTNLYRKPPQTLGDLIAQGYGIVMTESTYDTVYTVPKIESGLVRLIVNRNLSELSTFAYIEAMSSELLAGISPKDFFTYYIMQKNIRGLFFTLPEKIFPQHITMYFSKHSFLIHRFNELFMFLRSQGMIDYWARRRLDESYYEDESSLEAKAITLKRISGVFVIHLVLLSGAFFVFCLELAWFKYKRLRRAMNRERRRKQRKLNKK